MIFLNSNIHAAHSQDTENYYTVFLQLNSWTSRNEIIPQLVTYQLKFSGQNTEHFSGLIRKELLSRDVRDGPSTDHVLYAMQLRQSTFERQRLSGSKVVSVSESYA